jgi:hypothetical protein
LTTALGLFNLGGGTFLSIKRLHSDLSDTSHPLHESLNNHSSKVPLV